MADGVYSFTQGNHYQHLISWWLILELLFDGSDYEYAWLEHPDAGSCDDVTLHPFTNSKKPARYYQVKWHVDHRKECSLKSLTTSQKNGRSLLQKFYDSWKSLTGEKEVILLTNWLPDPELGQMINARNGHLKKDFFESKANSRIGRIRKSWQDHLTADDQSFQAFCNDLIFKLGFSDFDDLFVRIADRMGRLRFTISEDTLTLALGYLSERIRNKENKKIKRDSLYADIQKLNLFALDRKQPTTRLFLNGWGSVNSDHEPNYELSFLSHFNKESHLLPNPETFETEILPQFRAIKNQLCSARHSYIELQSAAPQSLMLTLGITFPQVAQFQFCIKQYTDGVDRMWYSHTQPSDETLVEKENHGGSSDDILVAIFITRDGKAEVEQLRQRLNCPALYLEPKDGPSNRAIKSDADANAFAEQAKAMIGKFKSSCGAQNVHLVLVGPAGFSLFLGQKLNAMGQIQLYEYLSNQYTNIGQITTG